jgi:hypothetical protein
MLLARRRYATRGLAHFDEDSTKSNTAMLADESENTA